MSIDDVSGLEGLVDFFVAFLVAVFLALTAVFLVTVFLAAFFGVVLYYHSRMALERARSTASESQHPVRWRTGKSSIKVQ